MTGSQASYLKAMGIVQWRLRGATAAQGEVDEAVEGTEAAQPAGDPAATGAARRGDSLPSDSPKRAEAPGGSVVDIGDPEIAELDWDALQRTVAACTRCELHQSRTQTVFGVGSPEAEWMFVGEAPGAEEDRKGEPFVGRAGKLLDNMLAAVGRKREEVYIANVLKCRPPNNRDPHGEEVQQCGPYLLRQIDLVKPKLLIALGRFAAQALLNTSRPIGKLRGEVTEHAASGTPLIVTYHPAYLLRNPLDKRKAWQDLCLIKRISETQ